MAATQIKIALLGSCDTKLEELLRLRSLIISYSPPNTETSVILIDVGREAVSHPNITIPQPKVLEHAPNGTTQDVATLPRGEVIKHMITCATSLFQSLTSNTTSPVHGIISAGGSGGTSLASAVMRTLPIGFPKLIVSTVASGDTGPLVGETDISMTYSVVDIAGMNEVLHDVFSNAAGAIVGMARAYTSRQSTTAPSSTQPSSKKRKLRIGLTMFGVTTPCIDACRAHLAHLSSNESSPFTYEPYVFHATGHGGLAMERLVREKRLDALLDLTTTELCDHVVGGVMSAGPERLRAAAERGIPQVISLGACDMVNFGARGTVPGQFGERKLFEHNPTVTLMRTNEEECRQVGELLVGQLRKWAKRPDRVAVVVPDGGVSMMSVPGGPFEDTQASEMLFKTVEDGLKGSRIEVVRDRKAINDEEFAKDTVERLVALIRKAAESGDLDTH